MSENGDKKSAGYLPALFPSDVPTALEHPAALHEVSPCTSHMSLQKYGCSLDAVHNRIIPNVGFQGVRGADVLHRQHAKP